MQLRQRSKQIEGRADRVLKFTWLAARTMGINSTFQVSTCEWGHMGNGKSWSADQLAARNLFTSLNIKASVQDIENAAEHFARHRQSFLIWAAQRAHSYIVKKLEAASLTYFPHRASDWTDGFRFAEQQIASMMPQELLDLGPIQTTSKGQLLRQLLREARS